MSLLRSYGRRNTKGFLGGNKSATTSMLAVADHGMFAVHVGGDSTVLPCNESVS